MADQRDRDRARRTSGVLDLSHTEGGADVGRSREELRRRRLLRLIAVGRRCRPRSSGAASSTADPFDLFQLPHVDPLVLVARRCSSSC